MFKCDNLIKTIYDILGLENVKDSLVSFRNMCNDEENILYDDLIANKIKEDYSNNGDSEFICCLFNFYIQTINRFYNNGRIDDAVLRYEEMCNVLIDYYGIAIVDDKTNVLVKK